MRAFRARFESTVFDLILYVPPTKSGDLVRNFSIAVSGVLGLNLSHGLVKTRETVEQKMLQNTVLKRDNVKEAFDLSDDVDIEGKSILLIDDFFDSGATVKEIGKVLTQQGASMIAPLVIAKTVGGDLS